jgi:hypothetical protein
MLPGQVLCSAQLHNIISCKWVSFRASHAFHAAAISGQVLCSSQPHNKYLVRAQWSPCGDLIATASYDHTLTLLKLGKEQEGQPAAAAGSEGGDGSAVWSLQTLKQVTFWGLSCVPFEP